MIALNCNCCKRKYATERYDPEEKALCEICWDSIMRVAEAY
jgi:hypothetical protein